MRKVERVSIWNAFKSGVDVRDIEAPFFLKRRHLLNPTVLAVVIWSLLLVSSPFSRVSFLGWVSFSAFLGFLFLDLKGKAESLVLARARGLPSTLYQGSAVKAGFEVHNVSPGACRASVIVEDHFGAALKSSLFLAAELNVAGLSRVFLGEERVCDAEMGEKTLGPMRLRMRDLFGIFEFVVTEDLVSTVELLPRVRPVPSMDVAGSVSSLHYGLYEVPSRGLSVNFSGIRAYVQGDPLRHIAWRKSAKRDGLMVKEFEKVVSCDITLALDMSGDLHVGSDHDSSWETAKLVCLGIAKQQLDLGNSVQFISNDLYLAPARGNDHFRVLTRTVTHLELSRASLRFDVPSGSTFIYVTVFDSVFAERDYVQLCALRDRGVQVFVFFLDGSSFLLGQDGVMPFMGAAKAPAALEMHAKRLRASGIDVQTIRRGEELPRWFVRRAS